MYFKQFLNEQCGCASYMIASRQSHEAAVIDPAIGTEQYDVLLSEREFTLRYVIDTHIHADHVSGARKLADKHGAALCLFHRASVTYAFQGLQDGEELALGPLRLRVMHTPGHRPELISLLVINPPRSPEASMVLTGDSLLVGDVGRPDFGGGDASAQYDSVTRLLRLPDWVAVFPGHFEGPCGKGMCGRPSTTIGFERLYNSLARLDRSEFVTALQSGIPARPLNMVAIEATNRGAADVPWVMLTTSESILEVAVEQVASPGVGILILDVREPEEYDRGHISGAVNIPQAELASRLDELPRNHPIITMCQVGMRSRRAAQFLKQCGYQDVRSLRGGISAWTESGRPLSGENPAFPIPPLRESEWTHAGVGLYQI